MSVVQCSVNTAAKRTAPDNRWAYERALEKSDLKPLTCWLLSRIAARADARTGIIPARFMPSVPSLAAATHMSVRSVENHLREAETRGWLIIERRPGRKSAFALNIPGSLQTEAATPPAGTPAHPAEVPPQERDPAPAYPADVSDLDLPAFDHSAAAPPAEPAATPRNDKTNGSPRPTPDDRLAAMTAAALELRYRETVPLAHAARVVTDILSGAKTPVTCPERYIQRSIEDEPDPTRFRPIVLPPSPRALCRRCGRNGHTMDHCDA